MAKSVQKKSIFQRAVGSALATVAGWMGAYNSTDPRRKILEKWVVQKATANQALVNNLQTIVNQCRQLERNCPSARAVVEGLVADIIGTGIDVAPDTGSSPRDDKIKRVWQEWCESAAVDGTSLWELQAQACREIATAGGPLWRFVVLPERVAEGRLPLAILPLEVEWLSSLPVAPTAPGASFVNGVEMDKLGRPIAYHLLDPALAGNPQTGERVLAKSIVYGFEKRRPGQALGEPMLAPLIERFKQEEDLVRIELKSAEIAANFAVAVTSEYHPDTTDDETGTSDTAEGVVDISPGTVTRLIPGEDVKALQSNRPNQQIAPFRAMLRGDIAACARTSKKWLDRDYSSATFMNTRMEQDDSTRMHKPTQHWLARFIASRPYLEVLPWIMLRLGQEMPAEGTPARIKLLAHKILPDLPGYVDPLKDGQAAIQNIAGGLSTYEEECSKRGKDWQKVAEQRAKELEFYDSLGLDDPATPKPAAPEPAAASEPAPADKSENADEKDAAKPARKLNLRFIRDEAGHVVNVSREDGQ